MRTICLHDRDEIEAILRTDIFLHLYSLGDLDDFFWPYTTWHSIPTARGNLPEARPVVLLYSGETPPVLLALSKEPQQPLLELLAAIRRLLPRRFYAHLSSATGPVLAEEYQINSHGLHLKMALADRSRLAAVDTTGVVRLSPADATSLQRLYRASYPGNWFEPRMLETGHYFGLREGGEIVSVAGVHVYSRRYRVAALGNITTHPDFRGRGFGTAVTARLCQELLASVDHIGLNVKADNASALGCYTRLGFEAVAEYEECMLEAK